MKIVAYLNEPAKYTVKLTEEVYRKYGVEFYYDLRMTEHNNKKFNFTYLRELPTLKRWKLYYQNWKKADLIISNGYLFDWFVISFILNIIFFRWKPIAIESDTPYLKSISMRQRMGKLIKSFYFRFPFIYGFGAGSMLHRDYFTLNGMRPDRVFLMPWVSINYDFKSTKTITEPFIFTYIGRFVDFKNIPFTIEEFLLVFKSRKDVQLKLVGDGPLLEKIKSTYQGYQNILFTGKLFDDSLEEIYLTSHCLVLASISEMWGLVVNEALSAGMPVLLSKYVGSRYDLVDGKETGLIFDPTKKGSLANAMQIISSNNVLYEAYSANARKLMHENWNYEFYSECFKKAVEIIYKRHYK